MKTRIAVLLALWVVFGIVAHGQQVQELLFMHYLTGADGLALGDLVDRFNEEHPHIRVIASTTPGIVEKLLVQAAAGEPPEIALAAPEMLPVFASQGIISPIEMDRFAKIKVAEDEYVPVAWRAASYEGTLYGIPLGIGSIGLYINPNMFEEQGLEPNPPGTVDELERAARLLSRDSDGDGVWDVAGLELPFNPDIFITWYSVLLQYGGSIFDEEGQIAFDSPAGMRALEHVTSFFRDNGLVIEPRRDFLRQQSAMTIRKAAARYNLVNSGVPYLSGAFPQFGDEPAAWAGVQSIVIPRANRSPETLAAIYTFVEWLADKGLEWANELGHIPARWDVVRTPEILQSTHHFGFALQTMHMYTFPTDATWSSVNGIVQPMVNQSVRGADSPRNLIEDAAQRARAALAEL